MMNSRVTQLRETSASGGGFAVEFSDLIARRRVMIITVFVLAVTVAGSIAAFLPERLPFTAQTGALAATIGLMIGLLAAGIGDATDTRIFGSRHVRGTGGELIAQIGTKPTDAAVASLLEALDRIRQQRIDAATVLRVGVTDASVSTQHASVWTTALASAAAQRGERVLEVALADDATNSLGVCDVVRDNVPLSTAAQRLSTTMQHARLLAGPNRVQALELLPELTATLPRNLDTYLVGLPLAASRPVVRAVSRLDVVLVLAEHATTTRVELIAGLDAIEAVGVMTQVVLLRNVGSDASNEPVESQPYGTPAAELELTPPESLPVGTVAADTLVSANQVVQDYVNPISLPDADNTDRIPIAPRLGRLHDDEDHTLLRKTAQFERYANRAESGGGDSVG